MHAAGNDLGFSQRPLLIRKMALAKEDFAATNREVRDEQVDVVLFHPGADTLASLGVRLHARGLQNR